MSSPVVAEIIKVVLESFGLGGSFFGRFLRRGLLSKALHLLGNPCRLRLFSCKALGFQRPRLLLGLLFQTGGLESPRALLGLLLKARSFGLSSAIVLLRCCGRGRRRGRGGRRTRR